MAEEKKAECALCGKEAGTNPDCLNCQRHNQILAAWKANPGGKLFIHVLPKEDDGHQPRGQE